MSRKLPRAGGAPGATTLGFATAGRSTLWLIQRSRSSGRTRRRLQSRAAARSPRAIARYTARRERPQMRATCSGESSSARPDRPEGVATQVQRARAPFVRTNPAVRRAAVRPPSPTPTDPRFEAAESATQTCTTDANGSCSHLVQVCDAILRLALRGGCEVGPRLPADRNAATYRKSNWSIRTWLLPSSSSRRPDRPTAEPSTDIPQTHAPPSRTSSRRRTPRPAREPRGARIAARPA
jgi:hypothetical protein